MLSKYTVLLRSLWSLTLLLPACQGYPDVPLGAAAPPPPLQLNLSRDEGFKTMVASQPADVVSLRFCLLEHTSGVSPAGGELLQPVGQVFSYTIDHASPYRLNFGNVRANASGKSYWIAVAALDAQGLNITNSTGDNLLKQRVTIAGESGTFYLSTTGGNADFPGSIRIEPITYAISGSTALGVALKLADG